MGELIKIEERNGKKYISARELHNFLGVKKKFADWIKDRIKKYGFVENVDYIIINFASLKREANDQVNFTHQNWRANNQSRGGHNKIDYILTLGMGKELSMIENNDRGRQARKYFIECEERSTGQKKLSTSEFLLEQARLMVEFEKRLDNTESRINRLEREKGRISIDKSKMTVGEYAIMKNIQPFQYVASWVGGKATALCNRKNLPIGKVLDIKGGYVNSYPLEILEQAFFEIMGKLRKRENNITYIKAR